MAGSLLMANNDHVAPASLRQFVTELFAAAGLSQHAAQTVAAALVDADLRGVHSHGVNLVPIYVERLRNGSVSCGEQVRVIADQGATAVLDAGHALGILTGDKAMALAVAKARTHGVGVVAVRHAFHFAGAFRYVQAAAREGCIGLAAANTLPLMPAPGGTTPVVGNNPVAVGVPRGSEPPLVLDMALSQAAQNKIRLAASAGRAIPDGWATDREGRPTTDPDQALAGMLLPIGGPKGFGLALMVEILTGVLSGGGYGAAVRSVFKDLSARNDCAHLFVALDLTAFIAMEELIARVSALAETVTSGPSVGETVRLVLPGQLEDERFEAGVSAGIDLDTAVVDALRQCAVELGVKVDTFALAAAAGVAEVPAATSASVNRGA
jgi:LDH2 family malate/lactate/ureidoglycolate dehydrogenase